MSDSPPLSLTTRVFVKVLTNGTHLVAPVVEPSFTSQGDESSALLEQSLFLREHLARTAGEQIGRFAVPETTHLLHVDVDIPREDLPRRLAFKLPVRFACVVMPAEKDAWVSVPALDHVLFVHKGEDVEEVVRSEIRRVAVARDLTPHEYVRLFPAVEERLEPVTIQLKGVAKGVAGAPRARQISEHAKREKAAAALTAIGTPLHLEAARTPPPIVGRERELKDLGALLTGRERLGAVLVGPENAGKSALVRAFIAGAGAGRKAPLVYQTSGAQLIAGMSGFGQWQQRVKQVLDAAKTLDAILYFDDLADLLAERAAGGVDFAGAIKPFVEDNEVRVLGELRPEGLEEAERKHPALLASLHRLRVEPLDAAATLEALRLRVAHDVRHENRAPKSTRREAPDSVRGPASVPPASSRRGGQAVFEAAALPPLVDLAERYLPYGAFPGKAIRLYEDLKAIREGEPGAAEPRPVKADHVYEMFSRQTGVPSFLLRDSTTLTVNEVEQGLARLVAGQREAVRRLAETIVVVKAGLQPQNKPLASFLFVGPTGVGKTELAKSAALYLFGSVDKLVRFDMSEFMTPDAAERLIRGTYRASGLLTRKVREQPFSVLLLDEIEKAHPAVFDLLLQVCGEGRLTDARGQTASFQNAILIMTSNLGAAERRAEAGFYETATDQAGAKHYVRHVEASFRPELVNRLDGILVFSPLTQAELASVMDLALEKIRARPRLADLGVTLEVTDGAKGHLADGGYSATMGARALRRHLEEALVAPIARTLGYLGDGASGVQVDVSLVAEERTRDSSTLAIADYGALRLRARKKKADRAARDLQGVDDVAALRRFVDRVVQLDDVERVKERIDSLTTDLATLDGTKRDPRKQADIAQMMAEHHRLRELYDRTDAARLDVHSAEELVLGALFEGAPIGPMLGEARAASERFRRTLPYLFVALDPERDRISLVLEELDAGAFDHWLEPFLGLCKAHRWQVILHMDGGARTREDKWPETRRWGPPRTIADLESLLGDPKRRPRNVLLRVQGPYAGAMLGIEQGLHRIVGPGKADTDKALSVCVHFVAMQTTMNDKDWDHPSFVPPAIESADLRRKAQPAREFDVSAGTVTLLAKRVTVPGTIADFFEDHELYAGEHLLAMQDDAKLARDARAGRKAG